MVFKLQDLEKDGKMINDQDIEEPMLLAGVSLADQKAKGEKSRLVNQLSTLVDAKYISEHEAGFQSKLEEQKKETLQTLFRERQVDNLSNLIYGSPKEDNNDEEIETDASSLEHDTNRYDVNPMKLSIYKQVNYKKLLKKKFVTGISKDKILENLLNMSDSDEEGKDK